jgi:hypothetical protein
MPLQFHRVVEEMEIWGANSDGYSFTISFFGNFAGPGFQNRSGYVASWRPVCTENFIRVDEMTESPQLKE